MTRTASFVFLFLLFFSQQKYGESFGDFTNHNDLDNVNKDNSFTQCVLQNVDKMSYFSQKERKKIKLITETFMQTISTKIGFYDVESDTQIQTMKVDFALSIAEILTVDDLRNFKDIFLKNNAFSKTLQMCCITSMECDNKQVIIEIQQLITGIINDVVLDEKVTEFDALKESDLKIRTFKSQTASPSFIMDSSSMYALHPKRLTSNAEIKYKAEFSSPENLSSASILDLIDQLTNRVTSSDNFQSLFETGNSSHIAIRRTLSLIGKTISNFPLQNNSSHRMKYAVLKSIINVGNSASVSSYRQAVATSVISELSASRALTSPNESEIAPRYLNIFFQKSSSVPKQKDIAISKDQEAVTTFGGSRSTSDASETGDDFNIFNKKKKRSIRKKRESITIEDEDIRNCANAVQQNSEIHLSCNKIFSRGVWDDKADRTLDGDIKKLITLMYGGQRRNLEKVLNFIDSHVPNYVRELIVSYYTITNEFRANDDFSLPENRPYLLQIKNAVAEIKTMNGGEYAEKYFYAKQIHKDMVEDMLMNLQALENRESITITDEDVKNCVNSVNQNLLEESKVLATCSKIFHRGLWDDKADRTLDGDISKLISLIYDGKRERLARVLYFIDIYVPKYVRELIVSYDTIVKEFGKNEDFNLHINQPYLLKIRNAALEIKGMNGDNSTEKYQHAKEIHKDMLENILTNTKAPKGESITITRDVIQNCANSVKLILGNESDILASCRAIFSRGVWDDKADKTLDGDIRKLISLIYDGKRENLARVLYFIDKFVPKYVRELIISYNTIINEFEKNEDFNLPINQPYFMRIRNSVREIKDMASDNHAANYNSAQQLYKDILENMNNNIDIVETKESISITDEDIENCANSVNLYLENESQVLVSCEKIFNRGVWDDKADRTLDGDIRKLIPKIYDGKRENIERVLYFIDKFVPKKVRERIVSYNTIVNEFEKAHDFNQPINQPYFGEIKNAVKNIKTMNGDHPAEKYENSKQIYKEMLENILGKLTLFTRQQSITITDEDIKHCANAVKLNLDDDTAILVSCGHIFNRGVWDAKADRTLDGDIKKLMPQIYDGKRENIVKVLRFIDEYVPKYVRELIVSYDTLIKEFEKYEDFSLPINQPYFEEIYEAVSDIKSMDGGHPAEKYSLAQTRHKNMLKNMLKKLNAIKNNNKAPTKENLVQNCIQAITEETSNANNLCNQILRKEDNRKWVNSDAPWLESDLENIVQKAYNGKRDNFEKVLTFVRSKLPYMEQTAKGYKILLNEMENNQQLSKSELNEFIKQVTESAQISDNSGDIKTVLSDLLNNLQARFKALKESVIQNCSEAIQDDFTDDFSMAEKQCNEILRKEDNRDWVSGQDYYNEDVKEIIRQAYGGNFQNLDKILKFISEKFPYSSQDILGYSTLLEELEKYKHLKVEFLNKLLERVQSSKLVSISSDEFKTLKNRLDQLVENKEAEVFNVFINALKAGYFTEEEVKQWKQFYGGENDFRRDWVTFGYVYKIIVHTYDGNDFNFNYALKVINRFNFAEQMVEGYQALLNEMEKFRHLQEELLEVLDESVSEVETEELSEDYNNKFDKLKKRIKVLLDFKKINQVEAMQNCIEAVRNEKWVEAKTKCDQVLLAKPTDISGDIIPEKDDLKHILITIYSYNLVNVDRALKLVDIFPYIHQRLKGYSILLIEVKKKNSDSLYFFALNQLKEKIKEKLYESDFEDIRLDHKKSFKTLREDIKDLIGKFVSTNQKFDAPKCSLKHSNETVINIDNINIKIVTHYDLPSYFAEYPFQSEVQRMQKEATDCVAEYKDFVLPSGWMAHTNESQVDIWVFNDLDIFGHKLGFASYSPKHEEFLSVDGMYLYRKRANEGRVQYFKHEFMHVLVFGGIAKVNFVSSVPRWFHDGLAELAQHGPCNKKQLNLLRKHLRDNYIQKTRDIFMDMVCLRAEEQKKEYSEDYNLNYFLSYFNVLYLRLYHPEFLQKIILETRERGWEGLDSKSSSSSSAPSVRTKLCNLVVDEKDMFFTWMENSAANYSVCYNDQPNTKFKLTDKSDKPEDNGYELALTAFSDGKFSWKSLIDAFNKEDFELIDKKIDLYRTTLKKQIEKLNLMPLNDLEQQKFYMDAVLLFLDEIHFRREEITIGYYYFYADSFIKLVFEDIITPTYQRASFEKNISFLKREIQLAFSEFLRKAFYKDLPPDRQKFLSWYKIRCSEVEFCTPKDLEKTTELLDDAGNLDDMEIFGLDRSHIN